MKIDLVKEIKEMTCTFYKNTLQPQTKIKYISIIETMMTTIQHK